MSVAVPVTATSAFEPLRRFLDVARGTGLRISAAESIDAMRTLEVVGYSDRAFLKDALGLVLAKTPAEKLLYDEAFERYFRREGFSWAGNENDANAVPAVRGADGRTLSSLAQMLEQNDRAGVTAAVESAAATVGVQNIRYFTQTGLFSLRILQQAGLRELENDIDALRRTGDTGDVARAQRLAGQLQGLREAVRSFVDLQLDMFGREDAEQFREQRLKSARLSGISQRDMARMRALVRQMARKLAARYVRTRRRQLRGQLDVRRTMRRNVGWGGVPFVTHWKQRKIEKPRVLVLCDVSGSVAEVSQFLLMFLYALNEALSDIHAFAFSGSTIDVSDVLDRQPVEEAIASILEKIGFQSSNYGNALAEFEDQWMHLVTPKTTVIIVGDARGNGADPRVDVLNRISLQARRLIWLNPEHPFSWGTGDSDINRYMPFCSLVRVCNTLEHLDRAIGDMLKQQS